MQHRLWDDEPLGLARLLGSLRGLGRERSADLRHGDIVSTIRNSIGAGPRSLPPLEEGEPESAVCQFRMPATLLHRIHDGRPGRSEMGVIGGENRHRNGSV
jgi:hypothetical protein